MNNYVYNFNEFNFLDSGFPVLREIPLPECEIPSISDRVEFVAHSALHDLEASIENKNADIKNRPYPFANRPAARKFTFEEDVEIFYGKVARDTVEQIAKRLQGKTPKQVNHRWENLLKHDPDLENKVLRVREEQFRLRLINSDSKPLNFVLNRPAGKLFSEEDDRAIFNGKVGKHTSKQVAEMLPEKTAKQIRHRTGILLKHNPDLESQVLRVRQGQAFHIQFEQVKPAVDFDPLSLLVPDQAPTKRRRGTKFTPEHDRILTECMQRHESDEEIALKLINNPPFTAKQIKNRWLRLTRDNPELIDRMSIVNEEVALPLDEEQMQRIFVLYQAGCTPVQIALEMGLAPELVRAQVKILRRGRR